ncbi:MAG: N-acetylneuraminate synthase family protein [Lachnospiraceae bacterium]|nr:N-acetylneuraminate synthase family protein [Lachnospiraceae bacterium]
MSIKFKDGTEVGQGWSPYVIAEVNSSHNGDVNVAKKMIDAAVECGCNCVKFQSWSTESLYSKTYYAQNPISKRFVKKFALSEEQLLDIVEYCSEKKIAFSSTPYSKKEVDFLVKNKVPFIKIASMELNNYDFLEYIAKTGFPIVLSTGMGDMDEIRKAVSVIESAGNKNICLLHCISIYPAAPETINLYNICMLKNEFPDYTIGFSDHSIGTEMASAAIALGACLIEKHLTLDKTKIGMDNQMATEPDEMKKLVDSCRNVQQALGSYERIVSKEEIEQRTKMRRSLIYVRDMKAGEIIGAEDLDGKRPGIGVALDDKKKYLGRTLRHDVESDTLLEEKDFM